MKQATHRLDVLTRGKGRYDFTDEIESWFAAQKPRPRCRRGPERPLRAAHSRTHRAEGPGDMTSHIRTALTQTNLGIPIHAGKLALGAWQGVYLFEHRARPRRRSVVLHLLMEE